MRKHGKIGAYSPDICGGIERCIIWNDPTINIDWEIKDTPRISDRDAQGTYFPDSEVFL